MLQSRADRTECTMKSFSSNSMSSDNASGIHRRCSYANGSALRYFPQKFFQSAIKKTKPAIDSFNITRINLTLLTQMHALLLRVLEHRQLSHAGQLFTMSDYDIIDDLQSTLSKVIIIFNNPSYCRNSTDQSVVEIVLARVVAAIRETKSIEAYAPILVDTLSVCLSHKMTLMGANGLQDTPHCKIASDILSSLFLHYGNKSVMTVTVPTAIRALCCGNEELTRSTTSYLQLAAIHHGRLLAQYSIQIISNIINGNFSLVRVVPQIYPENREPFHAHFSQLLRLLKNEDVDQSERLSILQLAAMATNVNPDLIHGHLEDLDYFLQLSSTRTAVLHIFLSLISLNRTYTLTNRLPALRCAAKGTDSDSTVAMIAKIVGVIGRVDEKTASIAVDDLISMCKQHSEAIMPKILKEIEGVAECFPSVIIPNLDIFNSLPSVRPSTSAVCARIQAICSSDSCKRSSLFAPYDDVTVINVIDGVNRSEESIVSKNSLKIDPPIISCGVRTTVNISDSVSDYMAEELDKNTETLANAYMNSRNRSSCSLTNYKSRSHCSLDPYGENITIVQTNSRDSPMSAPSSSHASRRCDSSGFMPIPNNSLPVYKHNKSGAISQINSNFAPTAIHIGKDGRVRPLILRNRRSNTQWTPSYVVPYETTFPVHSASAATKFTSESGSTVHAIKEEGDAMMEDDFVDNVEDGSKWDIDTGRNDVVQQFVDHRRSKIRNYVTNISKNFPIPIQCTVEGAKGTKLRTRIYFRCQLQDAHCVFDASHMFAFKTRIAPVWLHLMFLKMEASSLEATGEVIAQSSEAFQTLSHCWSCLPSNLTKNRPFVMLATSAFPAFKEQQLMFKELQDARYFDCFTCSVELQKWSCFSCGHPDRVRSLLRSDSPNIPVIEGQLKEKRGRWKFLKRWHTKYFTLSSAALTCTDQQSFNQPDGSMICPSIDLRKVRSVKSLSKGRKNRKSLPKAFEIFTDDTSYVLKANDQSKAEEWFQYLQIAVAHAQKEQQPVVV